MNKRGKPMLNCHGDREWDRIQEVFLKIFKIKIHVKQLHINLIKKFKKKS